MHVHSFLPILGLTLISTVTAVPANAKRDVQVAANLPASWSSLGCYTDSVSARGLNLDYESTSDMNEIECIEFCDQAGYSYAGVEYGNQCYCDYRINSPSTSTSESDCNMPCAGDSTQACGGSNRINIFWNGVAAPVQNPGVDGYNALGCYTDSTSARTLGTYLPVSNGIVFVRSCIDMCQANNFTYCGVEYGNECYGGDTILNGGQLANPSTCNMPCSGNRTEQCGGSNRLNLYQLNSSTGPSCAGPSGNSGVITNGGFENGVSPWQPKNNLGKTTSSIVNGVEYAGCSAFQIQANPSSYTTQFQFGQSISPLVQGSQYTLTFYQGRVSASASDGDSTNPTIAVSSGSQGLAQGYACSGTQCNLQGAGGSVYQKIQVTFTASGNQENAIYFLVTYTSSAPYAPVLFDEISLVAV